ncbi:cell division protein FtsB [Oceanospirillum linum]|uniref:cell division protein FtsB n=1 Tax=Oceanospirillum linum TaxID=966 RepID=UPI00089F4198|nr:cell division protein FtsB [Oceanospirillum linum]SEG04965.1 cell division protein FtsB [Oleiphilus messinensis]SMP20886.1 cell division protein FtsB [Oceanospirillum linum]
MFRFLNLILVVLILLLQVRLWFGESSLPETWQLESRIETRKLENADLAKRNEALAAEVADLRRGLDAIEERARYELGMVRPNETFFLLIDEPEQSLKAVSPAAGLSQ